MVAETHEAFRIISWYRENGYLEVPGRYDKKECTCRICGWSNWDGERARTCPKCEARYKRDRQDGHFLLHLEYVELDDWLVLRAIDKQIGLGERPYATVGEFLKEIEERKKFNEQWCRKIRQRNNPTAHRENSTLY